MVTSDYVNTYAVPLILVSFIFSELDQYCENYCQLKGMRTLEWKLNLGQVQVLVVLHCVTKLDKVDHLLAMDRWSWNWLTVKCPTLCLQ